MSVVSELRWSLDPTSFLTCGVQCRASGGPVSMTRPACISGLVDCRQISPLLGLTVASTDEV